MLIGGSGSQIPKKGYGLYGTAQVAHGSGCRQDNQVVGKGNRRLEANLSSRIRLCGQQHTPASSQVIDD
jgi:hypothetical protein